MNTFITLATIIIGLYFIVFTVPKFFQFVGTRKKISEKRDRNWALISIISFSIIAIFSFMESLQ